MSLGQLALDRATGDASPFTVENGNIKAGNHLVLSWFNEKTALIPMNARSFFTTAEHHAQFDAALIFIVSNGKSVMYPETIALFMDPKKRFVEFLEGTLDPTSLGMELTKAEQGLPAAYASVRDKFKVMFTAPIPPRVFDTRKVADRDKLKVTPNNGGKGTRYVTNGSGYSMGLKTAERLWRMLDPLWKDVAYTDRWNNPKRQSSISADGYNRCPDAYPDRLVIGCQTIQRNVVEALAKEQGWI